MKVKVAKRLYQMSRREFEGMLEEVAKPQVRMGVYAVEKNGYAELKCDRCESVTQLKRITREYRKQGFKVYANGR